MKTLLLRLCLLEEELKNIQKNGIFIDMADNKVCISTSNRHGEELTFPSVYECAMFTEKWMRGREVVGFVFISDISTLFSEQPFVRTPDDLLSERGVLINLAGQGQNSLIDLAVSSWLHGRIVRENAIMMVT